MGNIQLGAAVEPGLHQIVAEDAREGSKVGDTGRGEKGVTGGEGVTGDGKPE